MICYTCVSLFMSCDLCLWLMHCHVIESSSCYFHAIESTVCRPLSRYWVYRVLSGNFACGSGSSNSKWRRLGRNIIQDPDIFLENINKYPDLVEREKIESGSPKNILQIRPDLDPDLGKESQNITFYLQQCRLVYGRLFLYSSSTI